MLNLKQIKNFIIILVITLQFVHLPPSYSQEFTPRFHQQETLENAFAHIIHHYLQKKGLPGATLSIAHHGMATTQITIDNMPSQEMPVASLTKAFTVLAIQKLIAEHKLSPHTRIAKFFDLQGQIRDPRVLDITIEDLLNHQGGWEFAPSGDPMFNLEKFSKKEKASREIFATKILKDFPLQHNPGTFSAYSNIGFLILGVVIEKVTHTDYLEYINQNFANPLDITLKQAKTPTYLPKTPSLVGSFSLELSLPSFGVECNSTDIARILSFYMPQRTEEWRLGSLPGTTTGIILKRQSGNVLVVLIPDRDDFHWESDGIELKNLLEMTADRFAL